MQRLSPAPDLFLLDDGFSHLSLRRDLDLLAFPAADPFGGGRLLSRRTSARALAAVARASAVLLTGVSDGGNAEESGAALAEAAPVRMDLRDPASPAAPCRSRPRWNRPAREVPAARPSSSSPPWRGRLVHRDRPLARLRDRGRAPLPGPTTPIQRPAWSRSATAWTSSGASAGPPTSKDRVKLLGRLNVQDVPWASCPSAPEPETGFWRWLDGEIDLLRRPPS